MAEKTTKAPAKDATKTDKQTAMAAARAARDTASQDDKFHYLGKVVEGSKKLAPQAQVIVNAIQAAGKAGISRKDLIANLDGVLTTKQPIGRIVSYYQKSLVDTGHVELRNASAPAAKAA